MREPTHFSNHGSFKPDLNAVVATVYEIITRDTQLAEQILLGADISTIEDKDWVKHPDVTLDHDINHYRQTLRSWLERRNQPESLITHYTQAPSPMEWPQPWQPDIPWLDQYGNTVGEASPSSYVERAALRALGLKFVEWERPAHNNIPEAFCVLGNRKLVAQAGL